jgi:hypothetical protein
MTNLTRILCGSFLAGAAIVMTAGSGTAREIDARPGDAAAGNGRWDEACAVACRRWRQCGMADEETRCAADCAGSATFEGRGVKQAYAICLARLTCGALRQSLAMDADE